MITMSEREVGRLRVLTQLLCGALSQAQAATILGISERQMRRIQRRYEAQGEAGLTHRLRGQASNRKLDPERVRQAQQLIARHYPDFGPTLACEMLACEMLAERHDMVLSVESVRTLMRQAGLWRAKPKRLKPIHPIRERRARRGELIQIDGSPHDWFEGRGPYCTLLVFIDDATSALMALRFVPVETTAAYLQTLRDYILQHGLPMCLYSDRHSIFRTCNTAADDPRPTHFAQVLERLGIEGIQASSAQAKGRVERAHQTLQDRLVKALRVAGIDDMDRANAWLAGYIKRHNQRFAVVAAEPEEAHVTYHASLQALDLQMARHHQRRLTPTLSCQFRKQILQIEAPGQQRRLAGQTLQIIEHLDGRLQVLYHGEPLHYRATPKKDYVKPVVDAKALNPRVQKTAEQRYRPAPTHPWKRWQGPPPNVSQRRSTPL